MKLFNQTNGFYCFLLFNFHSFFFLFQHSCVADNALGRAKKYIEVSGRPGPAQFHSPLHSRSKDVYNLTWSVESVPMLEEIRILYRKLMVSQFRSSFLVWFCIKNGMKNGKWI
jgi:hypothetical protein